MTRRIEEIFCDRRSHSRNIHAAIYDTLRICKDL